MGTQNQCILKVTASKKSGKWGEMSEGGGGAKTRRGLHMPCMLLLRTVQQNDEDAHCARVHAK